MIDEDGLLLNDIEVAEAPRGLGHGRALLAFAEGEAQRGDCGRLWLYADEEMVWNVALYARLGFVETHRKRQAGF